MNWLLERNIERHKDFGDSTFLLQPNLKEGKGGLRDYHALRWFAGIKYDLQQTRDLEFQGVLSHLEYTELMAALSARDLYIGLDIYGAELPQTFD